ncbi:hypothetical protein BB558_001430, partial [Smittium angustum]
MYSKPGVNFTLKYVDKWYWKIQPAKFVLEKLKKSMFSTCENDMCNAENSF